MVELRGPSPLRVWSLSAFADVDRLDRVVRYRLTEESVARALTAGFEARQVLSFLAAQSRTAVPAEVEERLREWTRGFRRVRLRRAVVVTPDDAALMDELGGVVAALGFATTAIGETLVVLLPESGGEHQEATVVAALREAGFTPQWDTRTLGPRPRNDPKARLETGRGTESRRGDRSSS
jgi:hypothetical protein